MAVVGSRFRGALVDGTDSGRRLDEIIQQHVPDGSLIQIWLDYQARDFLFPWALFYGDFVVPEERLSPVKEKLWGYRYAIEQSPQFEDVDQDGGISRSDIPSEGLRVRVGTFQFTETPAHLRFFSTCAKESGGTLNYEAWTDSHRWARHFKSCDSPVLYFFSHGRTRMPPGPDGTLMRRLVEALRQWLAGPAQPGDGRNTLQARTVLTAELTELGVDAAAGETHIKLTDGILVLHHLYQLALAPTTPEPVVFLNMCQSAQLFPTMTDGLVDAFLKKRSRTVIGTEISMPPAFADLFGRLFFQRFFYGTEGNPVAAVLRDLRREFLDKNNPLGFAYTLYGDGTARLDQPVPRTPESIPS